jgi:multisubunit Na+/H+ antiporter MnhE subunit
VTLPNAAVEPDAAEFIMATLQTAAPALAVVQVMEMHRCTYIHPSKSGILARRIFALSRFVSGGAATANP